MALTTVPASLSATALTLTTAAQPNITSVGTLTGLTVGGNLMPSADSTHNIGTSANRFANAYFDTMLGTVGTASQPNITSVGTLTGLTVATSAAKILEVSRTGSATYDLTVSDVGNGAAQLWFNAQTNDTGFNFRPKNSSGTNTNALFIGPNGNVGVGTTTPDSDVKLHIKGDGARVYVDSADYNLFSIGRRSSSGAGLDQAYLRMKSAGTNTVVLDTAGASYFNGGNVGIGDNNPATELVVKSSDDTQVQIVSGTNNDAYLSFLTGTIQHGFKQDNTGLFNLNYYGGGSTVERISVKTDGNVGIGTTSPGARLQINTTAGIGQYIYNTTSAQAYLAFGNSDTGVYPQNFSSAAGILVGVDSDESAVFWNGTNTRMRFGTNGQGRMHITAGGNVLIGAETLTPAVQFEVHGSNHMASFVNSATGTNQYSQIQLRAGSALNWIWGANQNSTAWGGANSLNIQSTSGSIAFFTNGTTQRMRIHETSGNIGITDGNVIFANGHGIDFSANTDDGGSSTATLFEDYEEGTWTPTIFGSTSGGTLATISSGKGGYTKIGNVVTLTFYLGVTSLNGITGAMRMGGIPYQATNSGGSNQHITTGSMMTNAFELHSGKSWVVPYISDSATDIKFYQSGDDTGWAEASVHVGLSMIGEIQYRTV